MVLKSFTPIVNVFVTEQDFDDREIALQTTIFPAMYNDLGLIW